MTIDVDPDVHARLAAAAAAAATAGGRTVSYCDVIRKLLEDRLPSVRSQRPDAMSAGRSDNTLDTRDQ